MRIPHKPRPQSKFSSSLRATARPSGSLPEIKEDSKKVTHTRTRKRGSTEVLPLPVSSIRPMSIKEFKQPRLHFDQEDLGRLTLDIKKNGIKNPIQVRQTSNGTYEIIDGERRFRGAKFLGLDYIPAIVVKVSDTEAYELAVVSHALTSISPIEITMCTLNLITLKLGELGISSEEVKNTLLNISGNRETREHVINAVNISLAHFGITLTNFVKNKLLLLDMSELLTESVNSGELTPAHALTIRSQEESHQGELITLAKSGATVAAIRKRVKELKKPTNPQPKSPA